MPYNPFTTLSSLYHRATRSKVVKRKDEKEKWFREATHAWNARLPTKRPAEQRCIVDNTELVDSSQSESPFFQNLPLEIRRLIYAELIQDSVRLRVIDENKDHQGDEIGKERIPFKLACTGARSLLNFSSSCKSAYLETVGHLFENATFQFCGITAFWCFRRLLPARFWVLIQRIHLQYAYSQAYDYRDVEYGTPPYGRGCWQETWDVISKMPNLKHAQVDIDLSCPYVHAYHEDMFYSALKQVRDDVKLEVFVQWVKDESVPEDQVLPFVLRRGVDFREEEDGWYIAVGGEGEEQTLVIQNAWRV